MKECSVDCEAECCKCWWISLIPEELDRAALYLKIPRKNFVESRCVLFAEITPLPEKAEGIVVFNGLVPKKITDLMEQELGESPDFFLTVPFIAFDRNGENCTFLNDDNLCDIYEARPGQCRFFPDISLEKTPGELYDYCELTEGLKGGLNEAHFKKIKDYFSEVEGRGFSAVWAHLPRKAIVKIGSREFEVSRREFLELLGPYK